MTDPHRHLFNFNLAAYFFFFFFVWSKFMLFFGYQPVKNIVFRHKKADLETETKKPHLLLPFLYVWGHSRLIDLADVALEHCMNLTWRPQLGLAGRAGQRQALAKPVHPVEANRNVRLRHGLQVLGGREGNPAGLFSESRLWRAESCHTWRTRLKHKIVTKNSLRAQKNPAETTSHQETKQKN